MKAHLYFMNPSINIAFSAHSSLFENFYQTKASFNVKYVKTSFKQYISSNKQIFIFQRLIIPRHLVQQLYYLSR